MITHFLVGSRTIQIGPFIAFGPDSVAMPILIYFNDTRARTKRIINIYSQALVGAAQNFAPPTRTEAIIGLTDYSPSLAEIGAMSRMITHNLTLNGPAQLIVEPNQKIYMAAHLPAIFIGFSYPVTITNKEYTGA